MEGSAETWSLPCIRVSLNFRRSGQSSPIRRTPEPIPQSRSAGWSKASTSLALPSPLLVDEDNVILAGHARWQAAKEAGLKVVPVIVIHGLSDAKKRAYVLADNKIAELAGYDRPALALELEELSSLLAEDDLDLSLTGFEPAEIDSLFADLVDTETDPADDPPEIAAEAVSRNGDVWALGHRHRLLCDDARHANYARLMGGERAAMVFTDPPYNVSIPKTVGRGRHQASQFRNGGRRNVAGRLYTKFLIDGLSPAAANSVNGALHFVCMDWRHMREMQDAGDCSLWRAQKSGGLVED